MHCLAVSRGCLAGSLASSECQSILAHMCPTLASHKGDHRSQSLSQCPALIWVHRIKRLTLLGEGVWQFKRVAAKESHELSQGSHLVQEGLLRLWASNCVASLFLTISKPAKVVMVVVVV